MAETILGIDVGSSLIKLVRIERSMQGAVVKGTAIIPRDSMAEPEPTGNAASGENGLEQRSTHELPARTIAQAVAENGLESDRIVLGVSSRQVFVRHLTFPFTSSSKISQVLDFELEGMLPLPVGDLVSVFTKQGKTGTGDQKVLTGSMSREELASMVQAFRGVGLNIEVIDLSRHGLLALLEEESGPVPDPLVVVDAGWSGTEVFLVSQGTIVEHRFMATGIGSFLTDGDNGRGGDPSGTMEPGLTEDDSAKWAEKIGAMVNQVLMRWAGTAPQARGAKPEQIVLCGGGSLVQPLGPALELALHIPLQTLVDLKKEFFRGVQNAGPQCSLMHNAAGLALRARSQDMGFNFRTGAFAPQTTFRDRRKRIVHLAVCVFLLLGVYLFTLVSDLRHRNEQLDMFNRQIGTQVAEILPDVRKGMRPSQYVSILKDRLAVFQAGDIDDEGPRGSATEILQAVSTLVNTSFDVTLDMLTLDGKKVRMSGSADGFATVERMKQRLQSSPLFTQAVIKGAKSVAKDGTVQFTLELDRG
ncbi:PilN domain-containing protein [Desulfoplanes sp.]